MGLFDKNIRQTSKQLLKENRKNIYITLMSIGILFLLLGISFFFWKTAEIVRITNIDRSTSTSSIVNTYLVDNEIFLTNSPIMFPNISDGYFLNETLPESDYSDYKLLMDNTTIQGLITKPYMVIENSTHYSINSITLLTFDNIVEAGMIYMEVIKNGTVNITMIQKDLAIEKFENGSDFSRPSTCLVAPKVLFELNETLFIRFYQYPAIGDQPVSIEYRIELNFYNFYGIQIS